MGVELEGSNRNVSKSANEVAEKLIEGIEAFSELKDVEERVLVLERVLGVGTKVASYGLMAVCGPLLSTTRSRAQTGNSWL